MTGTWSSATSIWPSWSGRWWPSPARAVPGKSTLLNIIGLVGTPDHGDATVWRAEFPGWFCQATRMLRFKLGYLFQNFALVDGASVDYNLRIAQAYTKGMRSGSEAAGRSALRAV